MESLDDLVRQYQNSRERAELERCADEIIDRVGPELSRFIRSHFPSTSRNRDAWKDAFQETLLALITGLPGFPVGEGRCFKSWCYGIARNKVRDHLREQSKDRLSELVAHQRRHVRLRGQWVGLHIRRRCRTLSQALDAAGRRIRPIADACWRRQPVLVRERSEVPQSAVCSRARTAP